MYKDQMDRLLPDWAKRTIKTTGSILPRFGRCKETTKLQKLRMPRKRRRTKMICPRFPWESVQSLIFRIRTSSGRSAMICSSSRFVLDYKPLRLKVQAHKLSKGWGGLESKCFTNLHSSSTQEIDPDNSKICCQGQRHRICTGKKKECAPYWPRLLKENIKNQWLKVDFDKWVDEDADSLQMKMNLAQREKWKSRRLHEVDVRPGKFGSRIR